MLFCKGFAPTGKKKSAKIRHYRALDRKNPCLICVSVNIPVTAFFLVQGN